MGLHNTYYRNAVVTGACGGFGQALARELIASGASVALVGMNRPALEALAALAPERCAVYQPDVSDAVGHAGHGGRLDGQAWRARSGDRQRRCGWRL